MRKLKLVLVAGLVFSFASCVMTKTYTIEERRMKVDEAMVLVVKNNGDTVRGRKIATPSAFVLDSRWVKIDGVKYEMADLIGYQDKDAFYGKLGAKWVKQLKRGKISLYYYDVVAYKNSPGNMSGVNQTNTHFVFQKDNGKLLELSLVGISELLKDNLNAYGEFNAQFQPGRTVLPKQLQNHPKKLFEIIDVYNG